MKGRERERERERIEFISEIEIVNKIYLSA